MRRWLIVPLLLAAGQEAVAARIAPVWDRSNRLACTVVSAEICRYPGGQKTCAPAEASFDSVKIDYGKSQVNLLAGGAVREAWTIVGISQGVREAAPVQYLRLQNTTKWTEAVLDQTGRLRFTFQRNDGDFTVEARCRAR